MEIEKNNKMSEKDLINALQNGWLDKHWVEANAESLLDRARAYKVSVKAMYKKSNEEVAGDYLYSLDDLILKLYSIVQRKDARNYKRGCEQAQKLIEE